MTSDPKQGLSEAAEAFADTLNKCMNLFGLTWEEAGDPIELGRQAAIDVSYQQYHTRIVGQQQLRTAESIGLTLNR